MAAEKSRSLGTNEVDRYLAKLPADQRAVLEKLRQTIKLAAPEATEKISWGMPMFMCQGTLMGYAAFKEHCSLFPGPSIIEKFGPELDRFKTSKGTIQFTTDKPLPATLVKKLVKARMAENEAKRAKRLRKSK